MAAGALPPRARDLVANPVHQTIISTLSSTARGHFGHLVLTATCEFTRKHPSLEKYNNPDPLVSSASGVGRSRITSLKVQPHQRRESTHNESSWLLCVGRSCDHVFAPHDMNHSAIPSPSAPGYEVMPVGWKAEWSAEHARYFYVNTNTNESTWTLPASPPLPQQFTQSFQRKPIPTQSPQPQVQVSELAPQRAYIEGYPSPPPQVTTGYFPPASAGQQQPQQQFTHSSVPVQLQQQPQQQYPVFSQQQHPQQQYPAFSQQQHPQQHNSPASQQPSQYTQFQVSVQHQQQPQQQYPIVPLQQQYTQSLAPALQQQQMPQQIRYTPLAQQSPPTATPGSYQEQQRNHILSNATPNSNYASPIASNPQYSHHPPQTFSPPPTPKVYFSQQSSDCAAPFYSQQQPNYTPLNTNNTSTQFSPQVHLNTPHYPQQVNNFAQTPPQRQQHNGFQNQAQAQPQSHTQAQQSHRSSMVGGSMMGKMSSKFTSLQKSGSSTPSSDWKKWGKRAAIGVAGVGALALGVDAAGGLFEGTAGLEAVGGGGGGDFSGGGFEGGDATSLADAQTALDANAAQLAMEQQGQENALMLLDPVGTEYTYADPSVASSAAVGYGLI